MTLGDLSEASAIRAAISIAETQLRALRAALASLEGRPSEAQLRVLGIMRGGADRTVEEVSRALAAPGARYPSPVRARPHMLALEELGMIEATGRRGRFRTFTITAAGREAIARAGKEA